MAEKKVYTCRFCGSTKTSRGTPFSRQGLSYHEKVCPENPDVKKEPKTEETSPKNPENTLSQNGPGDTLETRRAAWLKENETPRTVIQGEPVPDNEPTPDHEDEGAWITIAVIIMAVVLGVLFLCRDTFWEFIGRFQKPKYPKPAAAVGT
jgi:hypothetical protein